MARIEWIEYRLLNWARWKLSQGGGVLGFSAMNWTDPTAVREPYAEVPIPTNEIEASETDTAVQRLPVELQRTVVEHYTGKSMIKDQLKRLAVTRPTLYARIDQAHVLLARYFNDRRERQDRERQRVDGLVGAARP